MTTGTFALNETMDRQLLDLIERREAKNQNMQALLERWVKDYEVDSYQTPPQLYNDTKTLLKQAKEVKGERAG